MRPAAERYTAFAIVLHWAIAAAILFNLPLGFWMHELAEDGAASEGLYRAFQLHKSIGLTVLMLSLVRLGWRIANPPPPLPASMPAWEAFAARATHWAFYAIMIGMPLSGWLFVSAGWSLHEDRSLAVPTYYFGLFQVPALFDLPRAGAELREEIAEAAFEAHALMAWAAIALAVLHVAAALKHHFINRDNVLTQMVPALRPIGGEAAPKNPARLAIIGGGVALTGVALAAALFALTSTSAPPAPQEASVIEIAAPGETPQAAASQEASPELAPSPTPTPTAPGAPSVWRVDAAASSVAFTYVYTDESGETPMNGRFTRWRADIRFDPENLAASMANVTIETASAETGAPYHNSTLPTSPWFNSAVHPNATFRTTEIRRRDGGYEARGDLTIRGQTRAARLPFTLNINGDRATMNGRVSIDRRDFGIGADAEGDDMIGRDVTIVVNVIATRAP